MAATLYCVLVLVLINSLLQPTEVHAMESTRPSTPTCGVDLPRGPMADSLGYSGTLQAGHYIAETAPVSCSGWLTGYFYYLIKDNNPVDVTMSMWRRANNNFIQIEGTDYVLSQMETTPRTKKKSSSRTTGEVLLTDRIPVIRGSLPALELSSQYSDDGGSIADSNQHTLCHLTSLSSTQPILSCINSDRILLIQPLVEPIICPEINISLSNGKMVYSDSARQYGDSIKYVCDSGYVQSGTKTRVCQSNGQWSGSESQCIPEPNPVTSLNSSAYKIRKTINFSDLPSDIILSVLPSNSPETEQVVQGYGIIAVLLIVPVVAVSVVTVTLIVIILMKSYKTSKSRRNQTINDLQPDNILMTNYSYNNPIAFIGATITQNSLTDSMYDTDKIKLAKNISYQRNSSQAGNTIVLEQERDCSSAENAIKKEKDEHAINSTRPVTEVFDCYELF